MVKYRKNEVLTIFGRMPLQFGKNEIEITKIFPSQLSSLKRDKRIQITKIIRRL